MGYVARLGRQTRAFVSRIAAAAAATAVVVGAKLRL